MSKKRTKTAPTNRVIGYVRVSTAKQATTGLSLAAQRERIEVYCRLMGLSLVDVIEDPGASAGDLKRPGLQRVLGELKGGTADTLVVASLSRLTRSVGDLVNLLDGPLKARGLHSVAEQLDTSSAAGRLVLNVLTAVAEWERMAAAERTAEIKAGQKARGEYMGGQAPYGYRTVDGLLVEDPSEIGVLDVVKLLSARGLSLRGIANQLKSIGVVSRTGNPFAAQQVARMLTPTYENTGALKNRGYGQGTNT